MSKKKLSPEIQAIISALDAAHYATAAGLLKSFLTENPDSQKGWLDFGHALGQLARYDEAEAACQKAIELANDDPCDVIFGQIGNLYRDRGEFKTASEWYQKQIEADPSDATGYIFLANIEIRLGNSEGAEKTLLSSLKCENGIVEEAHYSLGLLYRTLGKLFDAKRQFELALEIDPKYHAATVALKDVKAAASMPPTDG